MANVLADTIAACAPAPVKDGPLDLLWRAVATNTVCRAQCSLSRTQKMCALVVVPQLPNMVDERVVDRVAGWELDERDLAQYQ